jgi:uncharacterized protein
MAKPSGPRCNLKCEYCFYLRKEQYFKGQGHRMNMSDPVLEAYVRKYIEAVNEPEVVFAWQGGEPTLMGLAFFRKALRLQQRFGKGRRIANTLQTNGVLLNDEWCRFLADNRFLVGLSLDGPQDIHDRYRKDRSGNPTFQKTVQALERMRKHRVEFNVLACIHRASSGRPQEVYQFFRDSGVRFIQFIPVIERQEDQQEEPGKILQMAPWSVDPEGYGEFLVGIFNEWIMQDVGRIHVMNIEWTLASWMGVPQGSCTHAPRCGLSLIIEHNGDIYACDHFMYPEFRLGNILHDDLKAMVLSDRQRNFGARKEHGLSSACRQCALLFACHGGCPKHRFGRVAAGEQGVHYLCAGTKRYLDHVAPAMQIMSELLRRGLPVSRVMELIHGNFQYKSTTGSV